MNGDARRAPVLLLCGGRSGEHEVSLASASSVMEAAGDLLDLLPRVIARDGRLLSETASRQALHAGRSDIVRDPEADPNLVSGLARLGRESIGVAFPLLHGPNGEDGTVQGLLDVLDVPYVGSDVLASATGMDKVTMKRVFSAADLPQVGWREVTAARWRRDGAAAHAELASLPWPRFVKPAALGSSVGILRVAEPEAMDAALEEAFRHGRRAIVEAGVTGGREIEVAVLGNDAPTVSPPGEIRIPSDVFYDYQHKYSDGAAQLLIPAELDEAVARRIRELAIAAFEAIHASGLARVDFFVTPAEEVLVNEINTMPGFTRHSMYPKLWQAAGLPYPDLIVRLVELAHERHA